MQSTFQCKHCFVMHSFQNPPYVAAPTSVCSVLNKRTNNKVLFGQWANGKRIKENRLGFRNPFYFFHNMSEFPNILIPCLHAKTPCLCLHFSMFPCLMSTSPCLRVSGIPQTENGTHGKWHLPFVFCERKTETANFHLFAANRKKKRKCVFLC